MNEDIVLGSTNRFFVDYRKSCLLIVNTALLDLVVCLMIDLHILLNFKFLTLMNFDIEKLFLVPL